MLATAEPLTRLVRVVAPLRLGHLSLANRIALAPTTTNLAVAGFVTDEMIAFYRARARGGIGLLFTESINVHPSAGGRGVHLAGWHADAVNGLRRLVEAIHSENVPIVAQLRHAGRNADVGATNAATWSASALRSTSAHHAPHAMTTGEIGELVGAYARVAAVCVAAGFDGVEIQMGHGDLLQQFLSPHSNKRDDPYGGSEERRLRLAVEVVRAVSVSLDGKALLGLRVPGEEPHNDGLGAEMCQRIAQSLATTAPLAYLSVTTGADSAASPAHATGDMHLPSANQLHAAAGVKAAVGALPVVAVSRYTSLEQAEETLARGASDVIAMSRALIADPDLVRKMVEAKQEAIRPCIACNRCAAQIDNGHPIRCTINARVGREREHPAVRPSAAPKRVLVVGGGIAGLEAALEARTRGHRVVVWEKSGELGGQLRLARQGIGRADLDRARTYYAAELQRLGVAVQFGVEADVERVKGIGADAVIVATGSRPTMAAIPGYGRMIPASKLLEPEPLGGEHIIILDTEGGWTTASAAETAAGRGARIGIVTPAEQLLWGIPRASRAPLLERLRRAHVSAYVLRRPVNYEARTLLVEDIVGGKVEHIPAVSRVYVSQPRHADDELAQALRAEMPELTVLVAGDANAPRQLLEAVHDGFEAANALP